MTCFEVSGENAADVIKVLMGMNQLYWPRIVVKKGAGENGSMHKMQMENDMHTVREGTVQAGEGLGATSEKGSSSAKEKSVAAVEKLIDDLRENAKWIANVPSQEDLRNNILQAARLLEMGLQRREFLDYGNYIKDKEILKLMEKYE